MRTLKPVAVAVAVAAAVALAACSRMAASPAQPEPAGAAPPAAERTPDVPYVPTPPAVVDEMLRLAAVKPGDVVYDLGCGDGRIVVTAAQRFGVRGVGIDIDPERVAEARENVRSAGLDGRVEIRQQDLFTTDFREATVVTIYLLPGVNLRLRPRLLEQLRPGARIVSHAFDMDDWRPDRTVTVGASTVYLWTVPERGAPLPLR
jgi:protein-L-isoaspartate O-methyltransferase